MCGPAEAVGPVAGPTPAGRGGTGRPLVRMIETNSRQRNSVKKNEGGCCSRPWARENSSAPAPTIITYGVCSITARASAIGCRVNCTSATDPTASVAPSISAASISFFPSAANAEPRPALNSGSSSSTFTAASTASSALPCRLRTADPAESAFARESW